MHCFLQIVPLAGPLFVTHPVHHDCWGPFSEPRIGKHRHLPRISWGKTYVKLCPDPTFQGMPVTRWFLPTHLAEIPEFFWI